MRYLLPLLAVLALSGCKAIIGADSDEALGYAKEFVAKNFPGTEAVNLECQSGDSDDNGYVSCTASLKDAKGDIKLHPLECAATYFYEFRWSQTGCRTPKVGQ